LTIRITLLLGGPSACGPEKPTPARRPPPQAHPARRPLGSASTVSGEWVPVRQVCSVSLAHVLLTRSLETRENRLPTATAATSPFCLPSLPSSPSFRVCRRRRPIRGRCHQQQPWRCCPRPRLTQVRALLVSLLSFLSDLPPPARLRCTPRRAPREARLERFHPGGSRPAHPLHHTFSPALVSRCPCRHHRNVRDIRNVLALLMDRP
jgi:hypothetical protein